MTGFEPTIFRLSNGCFTIKLHTFYFFENYTKLGTSPTASSLTITLLRLNFNC